MVQAERMLHPLLIAVYIAASAGLFIYGINCYVLIALYLRRRRIMEQANVAVIAGAAARFERPAGLPMVTTQIPIYNEANVAERALRAAAAIDYPRDRHEIQVLDDSTDETRDIVDLAAAELRAAGHRIAVVRRERRTGFKAGALAAGLETAAGEFIAIFDADFVPPTRFLRDALPFFFQDARLALVQGRWGHLNDLESPLTRAQAIAIDGHFMVEQSARTFNGLLMNFNGTGGLWRRAAIADAGGWTADTLTEDLDLSYRAQLAGWHMHYVSELEVPGELPAGLAAFKSQQFRWAKGSIQTAGKLLGRIWRSERSGWVKLQASLHLTHYAVHPLMLLTALLALPALAGVSGREMGFLGAPALVMVLAIIAPNSMYLVGQRSLYPGWLWRLRWLPALSCLGIGISASNSRAVFEAIIGRPSEFVRTPKRGDRSAKTYAAPRTVQPWIEVGLGLYCCLSLVVFIGSGRYAVTPLLALYAAGFLATGAIGLAEARKPAKTPLLGVPTVFGESVPRA
jgi:cellulose synthase/poly-beta-1,6-N-acetylglucosamine synthase-like glycosyltransferase